LGLMYASFRMSYVSTLHIHSSLYRAKDIQLMKKEYGNPSEN